MTRVVFWRRLDVLGLERLSLRKFDRGLEAQSTLLSLEAGGIPLDYRWRLGADWRTLDLDIEKVSPGSRGSLSLQRHGSGWRVNGRSRPDLDDAAEPDLSATPFCNTLPIRQMMPGQDLWEQDVCYIDADDLSMERSRQRYERLGPARFRYVDLGRYAGFEARLTVDETGLVRTYEGLFERVQATSE